MNITEEARGAVGLPDPNRMGGENHGRRYLPEKFGRKFGAIVVAGLSTVAGGLFIKYKYDQNAESRINTNLETRLHDYGFPFDTARNPMGKIDVYDKGESIDIRCAAAAKHVVGLHVENKGPRDITLFLSAVKDLHGNNTGERLEWPVGSTEEVETFLSATLPNMCAHVKDDLAN